MKIIVLFICCTVILVVPIFALDPIPEEIVTAYTFTMKIESSEEKITTAKAFIDEFEKNHPQYMYYFCNVIFKAYAVTNNCTLMLAYLHDYEKYLHKTEPYIQASEYQSIANTLISVYQYEKAMLYAEKSIDCFENLKASSTNNYDKYEINLRICDAKCILGKIYTQKKEFKKASKVFQEIISDKNLTDCYLWFYDYFLFLKDSGETDNLLREYEKIVYLYKESGTVVPQKINELVTGVSDKVTDKVNMKLKLKGITDARNALRKEMKYRSCYTQAPDIEVPTINGERFQLSEKRGRVCVLVFWSASCSYTLAAMRDVNRLKHIFEEKVEFVNIAIRNSSRDSVEKILNKIPTNGPVIIEAKTVAQDYGISGSGAVVVIDKNGIIRYVSPFYSPILAALIKYEVEHLL